MGTLYKLDFASGKSYIGITKHSAQWRFKFHGYQAVSGRSIIYRAWRKYGSPSLTVLKYLPNDQLAAAEIDAIQRFKTFAPHGYNCTLGGELTFEVTEETKARISAIRKQQFENPEYRERHADRMRRQTASPKVRQRMSLGAKTRWSKEDRQKHGLKMQVILDNPQHRQSMRDSSRKRWDNPAERERYKVIGLRAAHLRWHKNKRCNCAL